MEVFHRNIDEAKKTIRHVQTNQHILLYVDYHQSGISNLFQKNQMAKEVFDYIRIKEMKVIKSIEKNHPHIES